MNIEAIVDDAKAAMMINPRAALDLAATAQRAAESRPIGKSRSLVIATAQWLHGEALLRLEQPERAAPFVTNALATVMASARYSELHADILLTRAGIFSAQSRVADSLADYQSAYTIYRKTNDNRGCARALILISSLYNDAKDSNTALRYLNEAVDTYRGDRRLLAIILHTRGIVLDDLGRHPEAEAQFLKALQITLPISKPMSARMLSSLVRVRLELGDLQGAKRAINQGFALTKDGEAADWRPQTLSTAAELALRQNAPKQAETYITLAFAGIDTTTTTMAFHEAHQTAYETFTAIHDPVNALLHLAALKRLDDQATKLATTTNTALMAARFDFANQELRISKLKSDELQRNVAFERARAQTQRWVFLGIGAATAIVIALLGFALVTLRRSRDRVRAANADLAVTNGALGKALAAKTEFLATTSHEIRTPLNGILGMTQVMLADPRLAPELRERLDVVQGAGITMRALVDDILDVAKMETGNLTIEHVPFDFRATVADASRMWQAQALAKGLTFAVDLDDCPTMIVGDPARVRQIVFNLLSNALKFTVKGHVALAVRTDGETMIHLTVSDSGIGIAADKQEDIFESFRQADTGTTRQFGGTGLGLAICRNLARAMDGDVTVSSILGQGAVFALALPLRLADTDAERSDPAESLPMTLVVDRNPITRSMFRTLLEPQGVVVLFAASVDDAVARLAQGGIAHVLIDDMTVGTTGNAPDALVAIVHAAKNAETTLLWPLATLGDHGGLQDIGITRILGKPIGGAALVAAMFATANATDRANPPLVRCAA